VRILTIFIDMIRANRLSLFNDKIKEDTPLDKIFKELGGTIYNNCFSEGPDTPRAISSYFTGVEPWNNGCNTRLKWPGVFLEDDLKTIFELFSDKNYKIDLFASINEQKIGFFPKYVKETENIKINQDNSLSDFFKNIKLEDNHFIFIGLPDYHWAFDDLGYTKKGEKESYKITKKSFDMIFEKFNKDEFDHIFVFSDHGFKFKYERIKYPREFLLNDDRTNIIMIHRRKQQNELSINNKLCSLSDMYATYQDILNINISNGVSLFSDSERDYILAEDHMHFTPSVNQNIELWSLTNKQYIYIRTLEKAILIDRKTKHIEYKILKEYDDVLKNKTSYGKYADEYEKVFKYINNIRLDENIYYTNGLKRKKESKIINIMNILLDFITTNKLINSKKFKK